VDPAHRRLAFDGFSFDPVTGELAGPAGVVRLPPKPARFLARLLERPGELVTREELQRELWPGQHLEVDQALAYTVRQVRAALGEEAGEPRFVETLPKRGYRFLGRLLEASPSQEPGSLGAPSAGSGAGSLRRAGREPRRSRRARLAVAPAVALVLAVAAAAWLRLGPVREGAGVDPSRIALLPLHDPRAADAAAANDRLTEALLVALTARPGLDVVGPATTRALRGTTRPHTELGRELGVAFVVSGGYRPSERILFVQLVRVSDGGHLFARRFEGGEAEVRRRLPAAAAEIAAAATADAAPLPDG